MLGREGQRRLPVRRRVSDGQRQGVEADFDNSRMPSVFPRSQNGRHWSWVGMHIDGPYPSNRCNRVGRPFGAISATRRDFSWLSTSLSSFGSTDLLNNRPNPDGGVTAGAAASPGKSMPNGSTGASDSSSSSSKQFLQAWASSSAASNESMRRGSV